MRKVHLSDELDWEIKADHQPKPEDVAFDLEATLSSVVALRARVPEDAFTASTLGTERGGNGVIIRDDGLILTIGYLITEADEVWLSTEEGQAVAAHVVGYDQASGFGLVQALGPLGLPAMALGRSRDLTEGAQVIVAGNGGCRRSICANVVSKREFAGYWEYVLDEGIFTSPPHPNWGGAALVGDDGKLYGIGSLFVQQALPGEDPVDGNMIVPIDLLVPILDEMLMFGRPNRPPHPWLGMYTAEAGSELVIAGLAKGGPADQAGLEIGDQVTGVAGAPPNSLADLFRRIWALGKAGVEVPLSVIRDGKPVHVSVRSAARSDYLKSPLLH
jgi:S1-C subfamily serine protease